MSVIAEFTVPSSDFRLGRTLEPLPDIKLELETLVPSKDRIIPYFWAEDGDFQAFESVLMGDRMVLDLKMMDEIDKRRLYRVDWHTDINGLVQGLISHEAAILQALGDNEEWEFRLRFENTHDLSEFHTHCVNNNIQIELDRMYNPIEETMEESRFGLTRSQREVLVTAHELGYFEVPRRSTLEEVAGQIGISDSAASERLRRAQNKIARTFA